MLSAGDEFKLPGLGSNFCGDYERSQLFVFISWSSRPQSYRGSAIPRFGGRKVSLGATRRCLLRRSGEKGHPASSDGFSVLSPITRTTRSVPPAPNLASPEPQP